MRGQLRMGENRQVYKLSGIIPRFSYSARDEDEEDLV